jgi:hypothetical protein
VTKQIRKSSQFAKNMFPGKINKTNKPQKPSKKIGIVNRLMIHEKILAKQLDADIIPFKIESMAKYHTIIFIGMFRSIQAKKLIRYRKMFPSRKIYIWWIGSDVWNAMKRPKYNMNLVKSVKAIHLSVSTQLQKELKGLGINSELVTLVPDISRFKRYVLPTDYTVAVYMPSNDPNFYHLKKISEVIHQTPHIKYLVYGNKSPSVLRQFPNVVDMGWVQDTNKVIAGSSCLLRLTVHDGFPKSVIEFICSGRYVICNHNYPNVENLVKPNDIVKRLNQKPKISEEAIKHYKTEYNFTKIKERFA